MTELTTERRAELAALLSNETQFEQSYPAVAEYLRTVAALPASPDSDQQASEDAFEVRVLHFLTGGGGDDPYWSIVAPAVSTNRSGRREVNGGAEHPSARLRYAQGLLQATFAYAVPSPETLEWVAETAGGRPVVEIGAGRGYWAYRLAQLGLHVATFDNHPPARDATNTWFPSTPGQRDAWHLVEGLRELARIDRYCRAHAAEHVLFLCWPPSWGDPMAVRALTAYERRGGDHLIYIGETEGGRSAGPEFFEHLRAGWTLTHSDPTHVTWQGLHDVAQSWRRASA